MDFDTYAFDSELPAFMNRMHLELLDRMVDEAKQAHHEAEETYCKHAQRAHSAENELRYALAKRNLSAARGILAEVSDIRSTHI